ncbi:hypothetical protein MJL81_33970, partial [Salmonella enterica subsp. enterica serovar Anatum]|nr:hypothetical protein [Salmonella enterica subsp. enterica serovar Anatum]
LAPWQGLNASFSPVPIKQGKLAFISQSAAVSNTILDWAQQRENDNQQQRLQFEQAKEGVSALNRLLPRLNLLADETLADRVDE